MAEPNGIPKGGHHTDIGAIRTAITHEWHYRIQQQISASPASHIEAMVQAVVLALSYKPTRVKGLCGVKVEHLPHTVHTGSLAPFFCTANQEDREPHRSERRRRENREHLDAQSLHTDKLDERPDASTG